VPRSNDCNVDTELILLLFRALIFGACGSDMHQMALRNYRLECFRAHWKVKDEATPTVSPEEQTEELLRVMAANGTKWAQRKSGNHMGI
jgi:hypothetical protein